jgi:hypothetical protein
MFDLVLCKSSLTTTPTNNSCFLCAMMTELGDIQCQWGNDLQPLLSYMLLIEL